MTAQSSTELKPLFNHSPVEGISLTMTYPQHGRPFLVFSEPSLLLMRAFLFVLHVSIIFSLTGLDRCHSVSRGPGTKPSFGEAFVNI